MTEAIPRDTLAAVRRYTRFHVLAEMNRAFAMSGLSIETVAARLNWSPTRLRRFLQGRGKLKIEMLGETAFAIDGSMVDLALGEKP